MLHLREIEDRRETCRGFPTTRSRLLRYASGIGSARRSRGEARDGASTREPDFYVTALVARWRAATSTFTWVNCGHPHAYLLDSDGNVNELEGPIHAPLGAPGEKPTFTPTERQLDSGERLVLVTDGITERKTEGGGRFGIEGIRAAVEGVGTPTAAATAMAILQAVTDCWREPLEDDGTVVVLCVA